MILYCAGAIRGNTKYQQGYKEIISVVSSLGHTALSELNKNFSSSVPLTDKEIYKRDIKWLEKSNAIIAEYSGASTGVGFEISYGLFKLGIPVLALISKNAETASALISGCNSNLITIKKYGDSEDLKKIISDFIKKLEK